MTIENQPEEKTVNHYVVRPDGRHEMWKEACRRVIAAMRDTNPQSVDIIKHLESTAAELIRGRQVVDRDSRTQRPKPGIWQDEITGG